MKQRAGFTLIEVLITIVLMTMFIALAVANLRSSEATARDEKRATDIDVIARGLELRYKNGNERVSAPSYVAKGSYPGVNEIQHGMGASMAGFTPAQITGGYLTDLIRDTTASNFVPPGSGTFVLACTTACAAENTTNINTVTTISTYVYEPITAANTVCLAGDCVRFNLYYRTEKDNVVQKVMSKNQ